MPPRKRAAYLKKLADAKVAKVAKEENHEPGDSREIASVCLLLRHFIHVTDNFCHLFCPFSQVVPWSSPAAPDFLSSLTCLLSVLLCSLFALLSPLLSFPSPRVPLDPLVYPPCSVQLFARSPFPMSLSSLRSSSLSLLSVFSLLSPLPAPRVTVFAAHRACQHDRFP